MPAYTFNDNGTDRVFDIAEENVAQFLSQYPEALLLEEEEELKTEAVVEDEIALAPAETVVTESQSETGLSESPDKIYDPNESIPFDLPQEAPRATNEEIENYEESVRKDKEARTIGKIRNNIETRKLKYKGEVSTGEKMLNSIDNLMPDIKSGVYNAGIATNEFLQTLVGDEALEEWADDYDSNFLRAFTDEGTEELINAAKVAESERDENTGTFRGEDSNIPAAIVNSITSIGSSVAVNALTLGGGLPMMFIGDFYRSYNEEVAKQQDKTLGELRRDGEDSLLIPTVFGLVAGISEKAGLKGTGKFISGKFTGSAAKQVAHRLLSGNKEGMTEVFQTGLEMANIASAKGENAAEAFVNGIFSEQSKEAYLQGFVGGGTLAGKGTNTDLTIKKTYKALSSLRSPVDSKAIENDLEELSKLQQDLKRARSTVTKQGIKENIKNVNSRLKSRITKGNSILPKLTNKEINKVNNLADLSELQIKRVTELQNQYADGKLARKEYLAALDGFKSTYVDAKAKIQNIAADAVERDVKPIEKPIKEKENTSQSSLFADFKLTNDNLVNQFKNNQITEKQYNADREANSKNLKDNLNKIKSKVSESNEVDKGISSKNAKASKETQQVYDKAVEDGGVVREDNKNVFTKGLGDKAILAINKLQEGLVNKITNSKFGLVPDGLIIGERNQAKALYKQQVEEKLFDLIRDYNPKSKVPLAAWLQTQLPRRANRAFEGVTSPRYYKDIESAAVQGMMAEENIEDEGLGIKKNIETAQALGISESLMNEIRGSARKALITSKESVDARKFKSNIARTFKDDLYKRIKTELGLKDTKTNKGLTNAIEANPDAFYDTLSVEAMRKARGKDKNGNAVNPFEEAGFLKFDTKTGQLEKESIKDLGVEGLVKYMTDPEVANNTRSDRQMHLVEALATSMAAREAVNLLENDIEFRQRFAEQQLEQQDKESFEKAAVGVSVNKEKQEFKNVVGEENYKLLQVISSGKNGTRNIGGIVKSLGYEYLTINEKSRSDIQKKVLKFIKIGGIKTWMLNAAMFGSAGAINSSVKVSDFDGKIDGKNYISKKNKIGEKIVFFKNKDGNEKPLKRYELTGGRSILNNDPKFEEHKFIIGDLIPKSNQLYYGKSDPASVLAYESALKNDTKDNDFSKIRRVEIPDGLSLTKEFLNSKVRGSNLTRNEQFVYNMTAFKNYIKTLNSAVNEKGLDGSVAMTFISSSYQATNGLIKISAPFVNKSTVFEHGKSPKHNTGVKSREEHNPPASRIGGTVGFGIMTNTVDLIMDQIEKSFSQTQLSKKSDENIDEKGYSASMPNGNTIFDNQTDRFAASGIDLKTIINIETGENLQEINDVVGPNTVDGIAASNGALLEKNSDQVENLIDRAIAKLTELTGTDGTLQINLAAIPVNVLIGGLRATKLAYQGGKALSQAIADGYGKVKDYMTAAEWSEFVSKTSQEVKNQQNPAQVKLAILNEKGIAQIQEQVRLGNNKLLKEFDIDIEGLTTSEIIDKLNILRKAKTKASDSKAPTKKARIFDFDDTLAKTNSNVLYTLPDSTTQRITGTGDAIIVVKTVINTVLNAVNKRPNINRIKFSSIKEETSRIKLYNTISQKLSKDLGWKIEKYQDEYATSFELVKPKNGGKKINVKDEYTTFVEDKAGNLNTSFDINDKTYNIEIQNKGNDVLVERGGNYFFNQENKTYFDVEFNLNVPGETGSLDATQFAEQFSELQDAGATFDYSEFSQVKDGSKGPLATLAKNFTEAKGERDVFVLTARPADSALAIQEFLRSTLGISIPLQNITGLANGTPGAKAMWVAEKVSEGYNDVFFADDVQANVKAVSDMLNNLGVTKRVQQAKESDTKSLEDEMDTIIRTKKQTAVGKFLRKYNIYVPPGADDFAGLLYYFLGKSNAGEAQQKFFQDNLLTPFAKGIDAYTTARVTLATDFKALKKRFKNKKLLAEKILGGLYTKEQAVRAYLYDKAGNDLGLNKADTQDLIATVEGDGKLKAFAEELSKVTKLDEGYPIIESAWLGGNIATDLAIVSNKSQRKEFLQEFINNKNQIFSEQNMKLIEQSFGSDYTDALSNVLERMDTGRNRKKGKDKEFNSVMNWINQSVAAIMLVNTRSAILQQLSLVNYTNWSFNNPLMMSKAMANVPQFLKDYLMILNSPFLKERRGGMSIDINLADVADSNPGNLFLRMNKKLLKLGFLPTQWGDSNAISFGGASWYRNRLNKLVKEGVSVKDAEAQAMIELQELSEETQQSSRVDRVSRQQASDIGRLILAFANTSLQYTRLPKKAALDLINRRGDWKTNMSKILYYGFAQNVLFTALQSGFFSYLLADDDDDETDKEKKARDRKLEYAINGSLDGFLRGMGYKGAVIAALKNLGLEYHAQYQKREAGVRVNDSALRLIQKGLTISPPISKKIGDIVEAQKFQTWKQYKSDPFYQAFAYANYASGLTNFPADRIFKKIENLKAASQDSTEAWQSIALGLGWSPYNVGVDIEYKNSKKPFGPIREGESIKEGNAIREGKSIIEGEAIRESPTPFKESDIPMPEGALGRANKDGTIDLKPGLSKSKKKEVIAHEKVHQDQYKSNKLDYTDQDITWLGKKIPRTTDSKIFFNGKLYNEGDHSLPWEKEANKLSKQKH